MVLTRSARKARKTQWNRDAVLNNPDLLCHIAKQADLPSACNLLTTSKNKFVSGADFFDKQWVYYNKQLTEWNLEHTYLCCRKKDFVWERVQLMLDGLPPHTNRSAFVVYHGTLTKEIEMVHKEIELFRTGVRFNACQAYLELLCDYFVVKNTAFDAYRKENDITCIYGRCKPDPERMFDCDCGTNASYCIKCGQPMDCPYCWSA